ncbi:MAG: NADP oxidoreductase, partial [Deltaproteobacteria bacterium]|nr:NADP oxidoreductase [Deltaproteobacteria bacterium]
MSFLDLDERLLDLTEAAELVYSPLADIKELPEGIDVILVEGAVANTDHLKLAEQIRFRSKIVVSFGDCAATGNVTSLRNRLDVEDLLATVYQEGPGKIS